MIRSVQSCPSASVLADLKDCLDFCSNSWVSLFCRQGGAALLLQVCSDMSPSGPCPVTSLAMARIQYL